MIAVIVPVLGRPQQIEPLLASIEAATTEPHRVVFVCSPGDREATRECLASEADTIIVPWQAGPGDFARKVNLAYRESDDDWIFQAATDLHFHPQWDTKALMAARSSGMTVVGTNDLGNAYVRRGLHSTHTLIKREYIETFGGTFDGSGEVFSERYCHNFVDTEFVQTALMRDQFTSCRQSVVEHLHPNWRKGEMDDTYEKGLKDFHADARLYNTRLREARQQILNSRVPIRRRRRPRYAG